MPEIGTEWDSINEQVKELRESMDSTMPQVRVAYRVGGSEAYRYDISLELASHPYEFILTSFYPYGREEGICTTTRQQMDIMKKHGANMKNIEAFATTNKGNTIRKEWDLISNIVEDAVRDGLLPPDKKYVGVNKPDAIDFLQWLDNADIDALDLIREKLVFSDPFGNIQHDAIIEAFFNATDKHNPTRNNLSEAYYACFDDYDADGDARAIADEWERLFDRYGFDYDTAQAYANEIGMEYTIAEEIGL